MRKLIGVLFALCLLPTLAQAQISNITARRVITGAGAPSAGLCSVFGDVGRVYVRNDAAATGASFYVCANTSGGTYSWDGPYLVGTTGANTALSNLASVDINTALLPAADATTDFGSALKQWKDIYFSGSLIGGGAGPPTMSGTPGTCAASAASKGSFCFSSTGNRPIYSYNAGTAENVMLTGSANTFAAGGTLDATSATSADAIRVPSIAGAAPTLVGAIAYDTTSKTFDAFGNGIVGQVVRSMTAVNCTTSATCATQADATGTGGDINTASGTAGTSELIFFSKLSIPASHIGTNTPIEVCAAFEYTSSGTPPNQTLKLKLGSKNVYTSTTGSIINASQTSKGAAVCWMIQGTEPAGASTSVEVSSTLGHTLTQSNFLNTVAQPVAAIATNGSLALQISFQWAANTAGNNIILRQLWVKGL